MDRTSEELRIEANDDEEVARTSVGLARVAWAAAAVVKRDLADALDEIERLRERLADRIAALEQERGALRKLVREAFEEGWETHKELGGVGILRYRWEASAVKRRLDDAEKPPSGCPAGP